MSSRKLTDTQALFALTRFQYWGWDTYRIAIHMGVREHIIYNALHRLREERVKVAA